MKIAINGFGRIGRAAFKIALEKSDVEVVAMNDLGDADYFAYLLKYDSAYGVYGKKVTSREDAIIVDGKDYAKLAIQELSELPWKEMGVDVVLECTGKFNKAEDAGKHLDAGAKFVVLSAPAKGDDAVGTYVLGANGDDLDVSKGKIVSNASCTTNCVAPVMDVLCRAFGVQKSLMTTVHAYTATQALVDGGKAKDWREARAAAVNIVPSSTGAAKATALTIPDLKGKFDGISMRVPILTGSISDITFVSARPVTVEEVNAAFEKAAEEPKYKGILGVTHDALVSSDIVGTTYSTIVDLEMTRVVSGDLVKVVAWYDNEWGYANRLVELVERVGQQL